MIIVFLNNKLIACDTIVPLIKELVDLHSAGCAEFLCFDQSTYQAISENSVLCDAIYSIGTLKMIGRKDKSNKNKLFHRIKVFPLILKYVFSGLAGKAVFLHFKALNSGPLKILAQLFPSKTVLVQGSSIGFTPLEKQVSEMAKDRNYDSFESMGQTIIAFNKNWDYLNHHSVSKKKLYFLSPPHSRSYWDKYILKKQEEYIKAEFDEAGIKPTEEIIPYMLCWMGPNNYTRKPDSYPGLFDETLGLLGPLIGNRTLFVKQHPSDAGDKKARENIQLIIDRHPNLNVILTNLHPIVLSYRARFFISNFYTTTFSIAKLRSVPTIEYTDYRKEILKVTNNNSMRPDMVSYFINRDQKKLNSTVTNLLSGRKKVNIKINSSPYPPELLKIFSNRFYRC